MSQAGRIPIGRVAGELAIIVVGVLIALAADSWREGLRDRDREMAYLEGIRTDMVEAREVLDAAVAEDSVYREVAASNLAALTGGSWDGRDARSFLNFQVASDNIPTGGLKALVGSGDLALVQNEVLRAALIRAESDLAGTLGFVDEVTAQMEPNVRDILIAMTALNVEAEAAGRVVTIEDLRRDAVVVGGTQVYLVHITNVIASLNSARLAVDDLIAALDDELRNR